MNGYSPKLPLKLDEKDGTYMSNLTLEDSVKQNLKMLILTNPGERIMDPEFGVGIRNYLFSQNIEDLTNQISNSIYSQVNNYLNYISVEDVIITPPNVTNENTMFISIVYSVPSLDIQDTLNITL